MGKPNHQSEKAGYLLGYEAELKNLETQRDEAAQRLGAEWSEAKENPKKRRCPKCNRWQPSHDYVSRTLVTRLGEVKFSRHYYHCPHCHAGFFHRDAELGLPPERYTLDVAALMLDFALNTAFGEACARMEVHHGIDVSATGLEHLFARQSASVADAEEPAPPVSLPFDEDNRHDPAVIMVDGSMLRHRDGWHETKLMRVNRLGATNDVFLAETGDLARLERQLQNSPKARELGQRKVLWLGDGAPWIWNMQERVCPFAYALLDFYHAKQHAHACAKVVFGEGNVCGQLFVDRIAQMLLAGQVGQVIEELRICAWRDPDIEHRVEHAKALLELASYYENNQTRMDYKHFRERGWPIGSGAIESAHVSVLQKRLKMPGMRWSAKNLQRMATMRAIYKSLGPKQFHIYAQTSLIAA